jgi:hypothetical protein
VPISDTAQKICTPSEIKAGVMVAWEAEGPVRRPFELQATSFKEFILQLYFAEWIYFLQDNEDRDWTTLPNHIKEYLTRVYSEERLQSKSNAV